MKKGNVKYEKFDRNLKTTFHRFSEIHFSKGECRHIYESLSHQDPDSVGVPIEPLSRVSLSTSRSPTLGFLFLPSYEILVRRVNPPLRFSSTKIIITFSINAAMRMETLFLPHPLYNFEILLQASHQLDSLIKYQIPDWGWQPPIQEG